MDNESINNQKCKMPYIGITGFMTKGEVETALGVMPPSSKRLLMVGILVNDKTIQGLKSRGGRHPDIENIKNIFVSHPLALNLIHYHTKDTDSLCEQLIKLAELSGPNLHGFQFNIVWPPKEELVKYRSKYPNHVTVLTIDGRALDYVKNSTLLLISKISEYKGLIDYILLDKSCGYGIHLDTDFMRTYVKVLHTIDFVASPNVKIVIAGGLSQTTLFRIEDLIKDFPDLSIDAENNLRDQDDSLNLRLTLDYLYGALQIFGEI